MASVIVTKNISRFRWTSVIEEAQVALNQLRNGVDPADVLEPRVLMPRRFYTATSDSLLLLEALIGLAGGRIHLADATRCLSIQPERFHAALQEAIEQSWRDRSVSPTYWDFAALRQRARSLPSGITVLTDFRSLFGVLATALGLSPLSIVMGLGIREKIAEYLISGVVPRNVSASVVKQLQRDGITVVIDVGAAQFQLPGSLPKPSLTARIQHEIQLPKVVTLRTAASPLHHLVSTFVTEQRIANSVLGERWLVNRTLQTVPNELYAIEQICSLVGLRLVVRIPGQEPTTITYQGRRTEILSARGPAVESCLSPLRDGLVALHTGPAEHHALLGPFAAILQHSNIPQSLLEDMLAVPALVVLAVLQVADPSALFAAFQQILGRLGITIEVNSANGGTRIAFLDVEPLTRYQGVETSPEAKNRSRSALTREQILALFLNDDGTARNICDVARIAGISRQAAHRYKKIVEESQPVPPPEEIVRIVAMVEEIGIRATANTTRQPVSRIRTWVQFMAQTSTEES